MKAVVLGAGPAGLVCADELSRQGVQVTVLERDDTVGGLSRTIRHGDFRLDLGPHRFFSKDPVVNGIWERILGEDLRIVHRLTRIHYRGRFFYYPLKPLNALGNLGLLTSLHVLGSYVWSRLRPYPQENTFEEWVSNRFGRKLFQIFFQSYTEKVWGIPCHEIEAEWASQRIQGLSLWSAVMNALGARRGIKTLADVFTYPRLGTGMAYERLQQQLEAAGHTVQLQSDVCAVHHDGGLVQAVTVRRPDGSTERVEGDAVVSSIPLTLLVQRFDPQPPVDVIAASQALTYRHTILVYLFVDRQDLFPDNWIYIHAPDVQVGRITNFRNWSPDLVGASPLTPLCLEYWCYDEDAIWQEPQETLIARAKQELQRIGLATASQVTDAFAVRLPRTYPVYRSGYRRHLDTLAAYLAGFGNLQVIGRAGAYKYNNQDHSILMGYLAARNLAGEKHDLWAVNTDTEYHEGATFQGGTASVPVS
jgi:protoporphyrinogen oxidase